MMGQQKKKARRSIVLLFAIVFMLSGFNYANSATQKPGEIKGLKCSIKKSTITLTWKKADRAKGYELKFPAVNKNGKLGTKIVNVSKPTYSFKLTGLNLSKGIKVSIKAFNYNGKKKQYGKEKTDVIKYDRSRYVVSTK